MCFKCLTLISCAIFFKVKYFYLDSFVTAIKMQIISCCLQNFLSTVYKVLSVPK